MLLGLNVAMAALVVLLLFSGNIGFGLIAIPAFGLVALRLARR